MYYYKYFINLAVFLYTKYAVLYINKRNQIKQIFAMA